MRSVLFSIHRSSIISNTICFSKYVSFCYSCFKKFTAVCCIRFLTKLLTEDLPRLFVRPKKIVLDFQKGKSIGPAPNDYKSEEIQEGNKEYVGELSVTLVDARKLPYLISGNSSTSYSIFIHTACKESSVFFKSSNFR